MTGGEKLPAQETKWYPIASSDDLPFRHTYHGQLLGREFAVWRADDGYVNVWENRCLHRGVRLSIGINDGAELKCQYHGWRYANRTAGCTYIPAHPADAPARTISNRSYPAVERYGLVWSSEAPDGELPLVRGLEEGSAFSLRSIPLNAPVDLTIKMLGGYTFQPSAAIDGEGATVMVEDSSDDHLCLSSTDGKAATRLVIFVQPVDSYRCVIRGVVNETPSQADQLGVLRHHNQRLSGLRDQIEAEAAKLPSPKPMEPVVHQVSDELAAMPEQVASGRTAPLRVQVARKWEAAEGVAGIELRTIGGQLPTFQPGAHIDVHMPNGMVRQYSLTNGPGQTEQYTIGVKLEPDSRGGSACMHGSVRQGDVLAISEPRNNFPLRRDAIKTVFVAGGIGITPLLSMARALGHSGLAHELHYFAQSQDHMAFPDVLGSLGDGIVPHLGLDPADTKSKLEQVLGDYQPAMHLYVCGPGPMLEATRKIAADRGWPDESVHFEYFKNTNEIDDSSTFEIDLARSAMTLQVPAGKTILEVLRENGVDVPSSCEQGACGTCLTTVLDGEPDHQDVYLNDSEKTSGSCMMTCVSRAKSARLVLDI